MSQNIIAAFSSKEQAENAVNELLKQGIPKEQISLVEKQNSNHNDGMEMGYGRLTSSDSIYDGTATGGALGAATGLALGAGALVIPGLGPILAVGPLAGLLSGAVIGGLTGGLIDYGVPEDKSKLLEGLVANGKVLLAVQAEETEANKTVEIFKNHQGSFIDVH